MNGKWFILLFIAFAASASQAAWQDLQWDVKYDADLLLDDTATGPTPVVKWDGSAYVDVGRMTKSGGAVSSVNAGILSSSTLGTDLTGFYTQYLSALPALDSSTGYTVELRLKVNDIDATTSMPIFAMEEATTGVNRYWTLAFTKDASTGGMSVKVASLSNGDNFVIETDATRDFHTFRIVAEDAGVSLYVDGSDTMVSTIGYRDLSKNFLTIGDPTGATDVDYELDYVYLYGGGAVVPEPATLSVFVIGAVGLVLVRSRARR